MKRVYRSERDYIISGICGGLGEYFSVDPTLIRIAVVLMGLTIAPGPLVVFAYILGIFIIPKEHEVRQQNQNSEKDG
jgi:phage shock protein PspC (stress-responsive transcriptional regulator)